MALPFLTMLLVCQLLGEVIAITTRAPVPGPVIGMAILFLSLAWRDSVPEGLQATAGGLLQHLGLLFVPAGVGVMTHLSLLAKEGTAIAAALLASTVLSIAVTGVVLQALTRRSKQG